MVFSRADVRGASVHGAFESLGRFVVRRPLTIIASWIVLLAALFLLIDPLFTVAQKNPPDLIPKGSPVLASGELMKKAFNEADGGNLVIVVLTNENSDKLTPADEEVYRKLVDRLRA